MTWIQTLSFLFGLRASPVFDHQDWLFTCYFCPPSIPSTPMLITPPSWVKRMLCVQSFRQSIPGAVRPWWALTGSAHERLQSHAIVWPLGTACSYHSTNRNRAIISCYAPPANSSLFVKFIHQVRWLSSLVGFVHQDFFATDQLLNNS